MDSAKGIIVNLRSKEAYYSCRWYNAQHKQRNKKFKMSDYGGERMEAFKAVTAFRKMTTAQVLRQRRVDGQSEVKITRSLHPDGMIGTVQVFAKEWYYEVRGNDGQCRQWTRNFTINPNTKAERDRQFARTQVFVADMRDKPANVIPPTVINTPVAHRHRRRHARMAPAEVPRDKEEESE